VRRRAGTVGITNFHAYVERLETDPAEFTALFNTTLIIGKWPVTRREFGHPRRGHVAGWERID